MNPETELPKESLVTAIALEEKRLLAEVEKAREEASQIVVEAEEEAERILEETRRSLPDLERKLLSEAKPEMEEAGKKILEAANLRASEMMSRARGNLSEAFSRIVEVILPSGRSVSKD